MRDRDRKRDRQTDREKESVCVCVCVRERERERERERKKKNATSIMSGWACERMWYRRTMEQGLPIVYCGQVLYNYHRGMLQTLLHNTIEYCGPLCMA